MSRKATKEVTMIVPKHLLEAIEDGNVMKFYKSKEWLKVRDNVRESQNYECQECKKEGGVGRADVVHHIKHLRSHPELALREDNLVCLCHYHHELEHPEKFNRARKKQGFVPKPKPKGWEERW